MGLLCSPEFLTMGVYCFLFPFFLNFQLCGFIVFIFSWISNFVGLLSVWVLWNVGRLPSTFKELRNKVWLSHVDCPQLRMKRMNYLIPLHTNKIYPGHSLFSYAVDASERGRGEKYIFIEWLFGTKVRTFLELRHEWIACSKFDTKQKYKNRWRNIKRSYYRCYWSWEDRLFSNWINSMNTGSPPPPKKEKTARKVVPCTNDLSVKAFLTLLMKIAG